MFLNTLQSSPGAKTDRKRVGRGSGSGTGKTAGRGHKGQKSRSGGFHKVGFEGGQMPLQRRLPKFGFTSLTRHKVAEIRLSEINGIQDEVIDMNVLRANGLITGKHIEAKVILSGAISRAVTLQGINATKGAREQIEAAGGKIELT